MKTYGKLDWAFSAGRIPFRSTGKEPDFVSHDKLAILNTSEEAANVELFIFYEDEQPSEVYEIEVKPKRLRKVRFNDLIDPVAMRLERNYSCYIRSNAPIVVQFSRLDSGNRETALMGTMAFPAEP